MSWNKSILVGNLTRDITLNYTQGGMAIAKTAIATSRKFTANGEKKEEVCFVDITFFARSAEIANQYLRKGSKILVEGRLTFEQWQDQNGQKRSKHSVTVETMQMLDSKGDTSNAPQRDSTTMGQNYDGGRYDVPQQQQSRGYDNKPYKAPQPTYEDKSGNNVSQQSHQATQNAHKEMPKSADIPVIDIDEDEIPF